MSMRKHVRNGVRDLKQAIRASVDASSDSVVSRTNIVSSMNVGHEGAEQRVSAAQANRIVQVNGHTTEESAP